jgi:hypothetical protein
MPPMDAKTLVIVPLRDISSELLDSLSLGMGAASTEKISDKVFLRGLPDGNYIPSKSGRYNGYKVQFGAADEGKPLRRFI